MDSVFRSDSFRYADLLRTLETLTRSFSFLRVRVAGRTALGRGLFTLSVGNAARQALMVGGFSGDEPDSVRLLLRFAQRLCEQLQAKALLCSFDVAEAFRDCGVTILPCLNPDGMEIAAGGAQSAGSLRQFVRLTETDAPWKANALGVELAGNFSPGWSLRRGSGRHRPAPSGFFGDRPESEAETKALTRLCRSANFRQVLALHGRGNVVRARCFDAPSKTAVAQKLLADCCGFSVGDTEESGVCCAFGDWFTDTFERPALTMQVGKGTDPSPTSDFNAVYERMEEALTMFSLF